jgi:hypothetical protein
MLRPAAIACALIVGGSCHKSGGGDAIGSASSSASGSAIKAGSGGSFSAELAKELGPAGSAAKAGSKLPPAGGNAVAAVATTGGGAGSELPPAGSHAVAMTSSAGRPDPAPKVGGAQPPAGSNAVAMTSGAGRPNPAVPATPAQGPAGGTGSAPAHGPVKVPAELAAIKLSLLPNWDRDIDEAGTFQYVVRIKGTQSTKTFTFRYGYDDPKAPTDRDQYKKYLQDGRTLTDIKDRQRGAAWFLEGNDASGLPAFRYLVVYGGKRLICYGSLYKDADSNRLGDDRDQTVIQAKQVCETLSL